ncbi:MAG TPA: hypothetical protein VK469_22325 [Candidatus Kapabacteria bacterium]|nr:hypothetical protein [Candidatus Kapabacteria bacterium]
MPIFKQINEKDGEITGFSMALPGKLKRFSARRNDYFCRLGIDHVRGS